jgi:WD40 repeat protein
VFSDTYWAIPYRGGGGPVYVSKHTQYGKVMPDCAVLNGHKSAVQDIAFSPFHSGLMATGSADCTVKIWDLDTHEQNCADNKLSFSNTLGELQPLCNLTQHTNSLRTVNFHPTVPNLLVTTSQDMTLRTFDVNGGNEVSCLNVYNSFSEQSQFVNISFNYNGTLIAVASKDRVVRIVDARSNKVVAFTEGSLGTGASTPGGY